jgi:Na+/proline symporter
MLASVVLTFYLLKDEMSATIGGLVSDITNGGYSKIVFTDWQDKRFFIKEFFAGAFLAIVMTGLDQDMMQKNLSCRNLKDAQKNIISLSWVLVPVNLLFLSLGAVLAMYAQTNAIIIEGTSDVLFPTIALKYMGPVAGITFIIGLISAAYSSADSALTALTTSFTVDFLGINNKDKFTEKQQTNIRYIAHVGIAIFLIFVIVLFKAINNEAVISELFTIAGYTYGPLLGLFAFGLFSKQKIHDRFVPLIAVLSPLVCYIISSNSIHWFNGYKFGFELLILNGFLTFVGLLFIKDRKAK